MGDTTTSDPKLGVSDLRRLNRISERLNQSVDVQSALEGALAEIVELMELKTGWLFVRRPHDDDLWWGRGYSLAAHYNLPPALAPDSEQAWKRGCDCQGLCDKGDLEGAYNEVKCSRLANVSGDREGLSVHASAPLRSGDETLGILNVAGPTWESFNARALELLSNAGGQIGVALERARLYDALRTQRIDEQKALLDLSRQLLETSDLGALLGLVALRTAELGEAEACAVLLAGDPPGSWEVREGLGWRENPAGQQWPCHEGGGAPENDILCRALSTQRVETSVLIPEVTTVSRKDWFEREGFRSLAVLPLIAAGRTVEGLLLARREEAPFSDDTVRFLRLIADHASLAVEKARLHQEALERQRLEEEISVARHIQQSFLPPSLPDEPGWEFAARYRAARQVGGDFYDAFRLPDGRLGLMIADVMGKGVPAALFMAMARTTLRSTALSGRDPAAALVRANELILNDSSAEHFLSAFYAAVDPESGLLEYALAGHNRPLLVGPDGKAQELRGRGRILGAFDEVPIEHRQVQLEPDEILLMFTDGVTEAQNAESELFGLERLRRAAASSAESAQQVLEALLAAVSDFQADRAQGDDITLLAARRRRA